MIFRSIWAWFSSVTLIVVWVPLMAVISLFDRDPAKYRTGRWFRRLGVAMTKINPMWSVVTSGNYPANMRNPYLVVANHQSLADIPVLSRLPWEMKWVGKASLFSIPAVGWMMKISNDIPVDRDDRRSRASVLIEARKRLKNLVSVLILPEGTRSPDGSVGPFADSVFKFAIKEKIPILPIALDGTFDALPRETWRFGGKSNIRVHVFDPIDTVSWPGSGGELKDHVRGLILDRIAQWRGVNRSEVDGKLLPAEAESTATQTTG